MAGYAVGMFFYDAFEFVQVTFLAFIVLALGASAALCPAREWAPEALRRRSRAPANPAGFARAGRQLA
jgi:hypothetical protein